MRKKFITAIIVKKNCLAQINLNKAMDVYVHGFISIIIRVLRVPAMIIFKALRWLDALG